MKQEGITQENTNETNKFIGSNYGIKLNNVHQDKIPDSERNNMF